jgi:hypothetical protein
LPIAVETAMRSGQLETKVRNHRVEIPIRVQKTVPIHNAERADDDIDGFANGDTAITKTPVISCDSWSTNWIQQLGNLELAELTFNRRCVTVIARTLQHFDDDKITYQNVVRLDHRAKLIHLRNIFVA